MTSLPAEAEAATYAGPAGAARVLVVTDRPVLARLIGLTLTHGAFAVCGAPDTAAAVGALERAEPHLVVLDTDVEGLGVETSVRERQGRAPRDFVGVDH